MVHNSLLIVICIVGCKLKKEIMRNKNCHNVFVLVVLRNEITIFDILKLHKILFQLTWFKFQKHLF